MESVDQDVYLDPYPTALLKFGVIKPKRLQKQQLKIFDDEGIYIIFKWKVNFHRVCKLSKFLKIYVPSRSYVKKQKKQHDCASFFIMDEKFMQLCK